jgi:hypothetical protein
MHIKLDLPIQPQPDDTSCGPTCLHALYRYYGQELSLHSIIEEVTMFPEGGTLAVWLACHALKRGFKARIYTYNLHLFDPTWFVPEPADLREKLVAQLKFKSDHRLQLATEGYLQFLELGGEICFEDLTENLISGYLNREIPLLTGLSATYLYRCPREFGPKCDFCDLRGHPAGHFVVLSGITRRSRMVHISDPLRPNPLSPEQYYQISIDRVIGAILLGIVTHDANLLVLQPR